MDALTTLRGDRVREVVRAAHSRPPGSAGRALVWDSTNTAALLVARALRRRGWTVDWIGTPSSPWRSSTAFDGERTLLAGAQDAQLLGALRARPPDALFLHGDDHVRWMLQRWTDLPPGIRRMLPEPDSMRTALSKERTMRLAEALDVPVLPTQRCTSMADVAAASRRLAPGGQVVIKGEGGAAGAAVAALRAGCRPDPRTWRRVTLHAPYALVQRRVRGPRLFLSVVYEHGVERAACAHEKVATFPFDFGPTAFGVTRRVDVVHDYAERMFAALGWHGIANIEFRQDLADGRWYFMEINPRVNASMGIQDAAGMDIAGAWAAICQGRGGEAPPGRDYREGVRYAWGVRGLALALRRPWSVPPWGFACLLGPRSDLAALDPPHRRRALRLALWMARHV